MSVTPALKRLKDLNEQVDAQRSAVKAARNADAAAMDKLGQMAQDNPDSAETRAQASLAKARAQELQDAEQRLQQLDELRTTVLGQASGESDWGGALTAGGLSDSAQVGDLARAANSSRPLGERNLGVVVSREQVASTIGRVARAAAGDVSYVGDGARTALPAGVVPQLRRRLTVLDLLATAPMDNKIVPFVVESGTIETAAETAENTTKPTADAVYTDAQAEARTIAHWVKIPKQILADVAGLQAAINSRLVAGVLQRLETQVIAGDGTGENLLGILNTTGLATVSYTAGELAADLTLDGISGLLAAGANPSAVALNPADWASMLKAKSSGSGEYMSMGPFTAQAASLWDVPAVTSPAIPAGKALVGDFAAGATVLIREGVNVLLSDSDQDDFTNNRVTMLGEGRFAIATWRPACFCLVNLTSGA